MRAAVRCARSRRALRLGAATLVAAVVSARAVAAAPDQTPGLHYAHLPSADVADGRFVSVVGRGLESLVGVPTEFEILIDASSLDGDGRWHLGIFDGDTGKGAAGQVTADFNEGHWDLGTAQLEFRLYADPTGVLDFDVAAPLYVWTGNDPVASSPGVSVSAPAMPDNDWIEFALPTHPGAEAAAGEYQYRLVVALTDPGARAESSFKLRATGRVRAQAERPIQLIAAARRAADYRVLYPNWTDFPDTTAPDLSGTTYDGDWSVFVELEEEDERLDIWEGDLDFGAQDGSTVDTDDPDTPDLPPFYPALGGGPAPEGAAGPGMPADDSYGPWARSPSVRYAVSDPWGRVWHNRDPSGNREWEKFTLATAACGCDAEADHVVPDLPAGLYQIRLTGVDIDNLGAFRLDRDAWVTRLFGAATVGGTVWHDADADGVHGASEAGIAGVLMLVYRDVNHDGVRSPGETRMGAVHTDASGDWAVGGVAGGAYIVAPAPRNFALGGTLEGWAATTTGVSQVADATNKAMPYAPWVDEGDTNLRADFGFLPDTALAAGAPGVGHATGPTVGGHGDTLLPLGPDAQRPALLGMGR